ncbi:MAG: hypothetical protein AAGA96_00145 [Verrucomicrobiota bacterium]
MEENPPTSKLFPILAVLSAGCYLTSLTLPGLLFDSHNPIRGWQLLLMGWWGLLTFDFPWFANIFFFLSLIFAAFGKNIAALTLALVCLPLSSLTFFVEEWYFNEGSGTPVTGIGPAFYAWFASFALWGLAVWFRMKAASGAGPGKAPPPVPS